MSEPKFTSGPWEVKPVEFGKSYIRIRGTCLGRRFKIANVIHPDHEGTTDSDAEETKANAHLIAAAPDLYKALAHLEPYLDAIVCYASTIEEHPPNGFILETKAALAKARGEG